MTQGVNYVLTFVGNRETLHDAVIESVDQHAKNDFADIEARPPTTTEMAHCRDTARCYFSMPIPVVT